MADPIYGGFTILSSPFFVEGVLPFILVFSLVFAVLQKSEILGKGKKQLDALVSFSIALLTIAFANAVDVIVQLVPVLAVGLVVILVFMVLWGMVMGEHKAPTGAVKWALGILILIVVAVAVLVYTDSIDTITDFFDGSNDSLWTNILFIVVILGAIAVVVGFGGKSSEGTPKKPEAH